MPPEDSDCRSLEIEGDWAIDYIRYRGPTGENWLHRVEGTAEFSEGSYTLKWALRSNQGRRYAETGSYTIDRGQCQITFSDTQPDRGYAALPEGLAYGAMKYDYDRSSYAHVKGEVLSAHIERRSADDDLRRGIGLLRYSASS